MPARQTSSTKPFAFVLSTSPAKKIGSCDVTGASPDRLLRSASHTAELSGDGPDRQGAGLLSISDRERADIQCSKELGGSNPPPRAGSHSACSTTAPERVSSLCQRSVQAAVRYRLRCVETAFQHSCVSELFLYSVKLLVANLRRPTSWLRPRSSRLRKPPQ